MRKFVVIVAATVALAGCRKQETPAGATATSPSSQPAATAKAPAQPPAPAGIEVGATMPAYSAKLLDDSEFDLAAQKGKAVFLNVWATWCAPCRAEIPELQKLHDRYKAKQFEVVGISVDEGNGDDVRQFAKEQKMTFPVGHDPDGRIANLLQTTVLPTSVILDRNGRILWKTYGQVDMNDPEMKKALDTAIGS